MYSDLPQEITEFMNLPWAKIEPYYRELESSPLQSGNLSEWLSAWTSLFNLVNETQARLYVATTLATDDPAAEQRYQSYLDNIFPQASDWEQKLRKKLLQSNLDLPGFSLPLRNMRTEADLFRQENLPLLSQELLLSNAYDQIIGAQTIQWEGEELTPAQLAPIYLDADRERRERAWRLAAARQLQDRPALNELWGKLLQTRLKIAANADLPDYRAYQWRNYLRFDYTPADCVQFHQAIEKVAVPVATRLYARRQARLGVETLRPWDLQVDPFNRPPLQPFQSISELESKSAAIFRQVDPAFHDYFELMRQGGTLDLDNRKGKAPGGYCIEFPHTRRPFIFINAVGIHDDVQTVLHEGGHAFHYYETWRLPYHQQYKVGTEFQEVASMGMEFLGAPYLTADQGGFYTTQDAARARIEHLESCILFWPYMAVVDAFQHWAYEQTRSIQRPGRMRCCLGSPMAALHARHRLERVGRRDGHRLAAQAAHIRSAFLLHRIWPGPAGRYAGVGKLTAGSSRSGSRVPPGSRARRHRSPA